MNYPKKRVGPIRAGVELNLTVDDAERLDRFLYETGRKRGPFIRQLILSELDKWESFRQGKTQVNPEILGGMG